MLLIYTSALTPRLEYIFSLLFEEMLGLKIKLTNNQQDFKEFSGAKFSYSKEPEPGQLFIEAVNFLFETGVARQSIKVHRWENLPIIFQTTNPASLLPFDPFAAAFYMVSRYEEYEAGHHDKYGRFPAVESIASHGKFLEIPIVHYWARKLESVLQSHFPELSFSHRSYCYVPTIDIDHAYAFRYRSLVRTLGGIGRTFFHGHFQDLLLRMRVLAGKTPDPYDNYEYLQKLNEAHSLKPLFFILFADYGGKDNNIPVTHPALLRLVRNLDKYQGVGIHPSLSSNKHYSKLESEIKNLTAVLNRKITRSRQHFLKLSLPKTYQGLIKAGIQEDYSMGYASHPGFRAGIAMPFRFFDLSKNQVTALIIHPVILMDVTLKDYLRLTPEKSLQKIEQMIAIVKSVNGEFVSLWHNESLGETGRWKGWRIVYEKLVKMAKTN
ncbi:MAG: polysaccharide deacetylase family protein [Bacteroidales bacterium]|nr:polysaccharide deacetylase family protein [Bacteroidales bacterium]